MKILVTGGAGFIGSHIVDMLVDRGDEVVVIDNLSTGVKENVNDKARLLCFDIRDRDRLLQVCEEEKFDAVFHEAAQTQVPYSQEHPYEDSDENVMGLLSVLEGARKTGVKKVVFSSSAAVYGDNDNLPLKEDEPLAPTSFYGLSKVISERYLEMYYKVFGLPYVVLRYANVYGERQGVHGEGGVVFVFAHALTHGEELTIYGDGEQTRDFVYVKDVAAANVAALQDEVKPGIYNISTTIETTVNALKEILFHLSGIRKDVHYEDERTGDIVRSALDNHKAKEILKWRPKEKIISGLASTYEYFVQEAERE